MIQSQTPPGDAYDMKTMNLAMSRISELNSPLCAYPQLNTFVLPKPLFFLFLPKQLPVKKLAGLKIANPSRDVGAAVSDLKSYVCGNA